MDRVLVGINQAADSIRSRFVEKSRVCLKTKNCTIPYFLIKYKKQSIGDYSHGTKTL